MTTATKSPTPVTLPRPRRLSNLPDLGPELLLPDVAGMPKAVRDAAAKARAVWQAYEEATIAFREAEQDVEDAPALDAAHDAQALEAGEDLPEPTLLGKRKILGGANRRRQAAAENVRSAIYEQAGAMREHYGEWVGDLETRKAKRQVAIRDLIGKLRDEFAEQRQLGGLLAALAHFDGGPSNWHYQAPREGAEQRARERAKSELASRRRKDAPVNPDIYTLTEALLIHASEDGS